MDSAENPQTDELDSVIKAFVLGGTSPANSNTSGSSDDVSLQAYGPEFVRPRFTPNYWMSLAENSTRMGRCMAEIAMAGVGMGCTAEPAADVKQLRTRRNKKRQATKAMEALQKFLDQPNPNAFEAACDMLFRAEYDFQGSGNCYIELCESEREAGGSIDAMMHVPCAHVRVSKLRDKYLQVFFPATTPQDGTTDSETSWASRRVYYRRFGDKDPSHKYIDRETGTFYATWPSKLPITRRGTSILHVKNYCPLDPYYGQPPVLPAAMAVVGNMLFKKFWNSFLKNNAHTPLVVIVENGNLHPGSTEQIELFLRRESVGTSNAGRVVVLQPDLSKTLAGTNQAKIKLERLQIGLGDNNQFLEARDANNMEIQEAFGMADVMIGGGGGTNTTIRNATVSRQLCQEHVIEPRTTFWERLINMALVPRIPGALGAAVCIVRPSNLDALQTATVLAKLKDGLSIADYHEACRSLLRGVEIGELEESDLTNLPFAIFAERVKAISAPTQVQPPAEPDQSSTTQKPPKPKAA